VRAPNISVSSVDPLANETCRATQKLQGLVLHLQKPLLPPIFLVCTQFGDPFPSGKHRALIEVASVFSEETDASFTLHNSLAVFT
jgi:hypothetical protein